jgi:hypothetical protein
MTTEIDNWGVSADAMNLKEFLEGVLERVVATFQSYNVNLPSRQYWNMGQPAVDCEQLVVSYLQMYLGSPGAEISQPMRCHMPRSATLNISISRATPVVSQNGRPPSADKVEAASTMLAIDSWVLMQSINELDQWDDTGYGLGVIATSEVSEPQGGFQTVSLNITMAVP